MSTVFVYVLRSQPTGRYYVGTTNDLHRRLAQHNAGGTASTKAYRPWVLAHWEAFDDIPTARRREQQIKAWKNPAYMVKALGLTEPGESVPMPSGR